MRKEFIACKSRKTAYRRCPWAAKTVSVTGGYIAFESIADYLVFKGQR